MRRKRVETTMKKEKLLLTCTTNVKVYQKFRGL